MGCGFGRRDRRVSGVRGGAGPTALLGNRSSVQPLVDGHGAFLDILQLVRELEVLIAVPARDFQPIFRAFEFNFPDTGKITRTAPEKDEQAAWHDTHRTQSRHLEIMRFDHNGLRTP